MPTINFLNPQKDYDILGMLKYVNNQSLNDYIKRKFNLKSEYEYRMWLQQSPSIYEHLFKGNGLYKE